MGAGIFTVVSVLVIADLTRGTGRFNLTLGAVRTAVGIGASLSQIIAGGIVNGPAYRTGFSFLAAIAAAGLAILFLHARDPPRARVGSAGCKACVTDAPIVAICHASIEL